MSVLPAIFANARRIALDIARIERASSKGGVNNRASPSSRLIRYSSTAAMARAARTGSAAPEITLQDCAIESIRHSLFATEPSGVPSSKIGAPIPIAIPSFAFRPLSRARRRARAKRARLLGFAASVGQFGETRQRGVEKPRHPHAFAGAVFADPVHAVIPIARSHQRQAVRANRKAAIERKRAMIEQAGSFLRDRRLEERVALPIAQRQAQTRTARFRQGRHDRRWSRRNARRQKAARRGHRQMRVRMPLPRSGSHQCWTSPSTN